VVSLSYLQRRLRWAEIAFEMVEFEAPRDKYRFGVFRVLPSQGSWPPIELAFDESLRYVQHLAFSESHSHFEGWEDPRRNVVYCVRTAGDLVLHRRCMMEELDSDGRTIGGSFVVPGEVPETLRKDTVRFRTTYFNAEPLIEEVDFARYFEEEHVFLSRPLGTELDSLDRQKRHG
jgi:hypothetical protein